jgi:hypothetical protein
MPFSILCVRPYSSYGLYSAYLYYYLADLFEISIRLKGFLFWPMVGVEKVGTSVLAIGMIFGEIDYQI